MNKILSISIACYNMEKYLGRCVDSMIVDEVLDKLEIIIVNDGSKDGTLAIANEYKRRYPQSVVVIDKPNGHYGSCFNAALKVATGKYFRTVDADDWVDSKALVEVVNRLSELDVDCVCTKYATCRDNGIITVMPLEAPFNKILDMDEYVVPRDGMRMHNLTYATSLLHRINYSQTEGIYYTDTEYVYIPLACSQTIYFMDVCLYQYLVGREGQSVDHNQLVRNNDHFLKLLEKIDSVHNSGMSFNKNEQNIFSVVVQDTLLPCAIPHYILFLEYDETKEKLFRKIYKELVQANQLVLPTSICNDWIQEMVVWYKSGKLYWYKKWLRNLYQKWLSKYYISMFNHWPWTYRLFMKARDLVARVRR